MFGISSYILIPLIIWLLWQIYVRTVDKKYSHIPGPKPSFLGLAELYVYLQGSFLGLSNKYGHYGPVIRVFIGPFVWIMIMDYPSYVSLYHNTRSFSKLGTVQRAAVHIVPGSLFITEGPEWRRHRTSMNPFFANEELGKYISAIFDIVREEHDALESDKPFALSVWSNAVTGRVIMKTLFDVNVNKKNPQEVKEFEEATNYMGDWFGFYMISYCISPPFAKSKYWQDYINKRKEPFTRIINQSLRNADPDCFWHQLIQSGKLSWEEFQNEAVTLMLAGYETTRDTLCWVLHSLTKYPEVKSKLKNEISTVLNGRTPTPEDLKNLKYLDKVVLETMRLHDIILVGSRTPIQQDKIGDYLIPKDSTILFSPHYVVKNSVDHPDEFDPERFTEDNYKELSKRALSAFGTGPHQCIGKYLAMLELKLITIYLIQNGEFEIDLKTDQINPHYPIKTPRKMSAIKKSV